MNPTRTLAQAWVLLVTLLSEHRRRPGPALGSVLAMMSGVAVFVAIAMAGQAARTSFESAIEAVSGRATHEVSASGGLAIERFASFASHASVLAATPIVEGFVEVHRQQNDGEERTLPPLRLLGIDPFFAGPFLIADAKKNVVPEKSVELFLTRPATVLISRRWAQEVGAAVGSELAIVAAGRRQVLEILGLYEVAVLEEGARDTALVDLATAQEILDREGRLDRIELIVAEGREAELRAHLEAGERLEHPARRGERLVSMIDAFRLNLLALGGLALLVGALLVFNSAQFSIVRRDELLGQLRCLGANRRALLVAVLGETVLFGMAGGALGVLVGLALSRALVHRVAATVTDLYAFVRVEGGSLAALEILAIVLASGIIAAIAGWFPALDAARTAPKMVGVRSREEEAYRLQLPRLLIFGSLGLAAAVFSISLPSRSWWPGLVAAFALVITAATWMPPIMGGILPSLQKLAERWGSFTAAIAVGAVRRSLSRTGGAAAGLTVALSMTLGVIIMVGSFAKELDRWTDRVLRADLFIADASQRSTREHSRIPSEALSILRSLPGVRGVETVRSVEIPIGERSAPLLGVEWPTPDSRRFELLAGEPTQAFDAAMNGALLISEPLSRHHALKVGDTLAVESRRGGVELEVVGVFRDYSYDRGMAITGAESFIGLFGDTGVRNAALYLEDEVEAEAVGDDLRRRLAGRFALEIRSNRELREEVAAIFERTFAVTYLLQSIATIMALVGIAVTLLGLFLERRAEIATMRAIGATLPVIGRLCATESLLIAFFPVMMALPFGAILAWILTSVINLRSFGWSIPFQVPWVSVLTTCLAALAAGLVTTVLPIAVARRQSIVEALREE